MLNTPLELQPCSSSPIRGRFGSAERVVFPVPAARCAALSQDTLQRHHRLVQGRLPAPDSPKNMVTSPSFPSLHPMRTLLSEPGIHFAQGVSCWHTRMQRQYAPLWQHVVHERKYALLHLPGILCAQNDLPATRLVETRHAMSKQACPGAAPFPCVSMRHRWTLKRSCTNYAAGKPKS